jgi:hypothetical protein
MLKEEFLKERKIIDFAVAEANTVIVAASRESTKIKSLTFDSFLFHNMGCQAFFLRVP